MGCGQPGPLIHKFKKSNPAAVQVRVAGDVYLNVVMAAWHRHRVAMSAMLGQGFVPHPRALPFANRRH